MFGKEAYLKILITFEMGERRRGKLAGGGWVINYKKRVACEANMAKRYCWVVDYVNMIF